MAPDNFDGNQWSNFVHAKVAPILTVEDEVWAAYIVLIELLKTGSTTYLAAGSYNPGPVLEAIPKVGLRGFEGRRTFDHVHLGHAALAEPTEKCLQENAAVMEKYAAGFANGLVRPCVNIVGLGRCTDTLIVKSKELADKYGAILNMHQCAFPEEVESIRKRTGRTPIKQLEHLGVLGPNVVLVHMLHVTDEEIEILARTGTHVVHNPGTALKIVYGLSKGGKFPEMMKAGVNVGLGTDAGDCANFMDIVRVMYLAALLFKDIRFDPQVMGAEVALEMATIHGARALGMDKEIGSLEPGKKADVVLFDADMPQWQPLYCEPYNLVYSASGDSADTVIVDGKIVMEHREVKTIDEREVVARIKELSRGVEARSGVKPPTRWPIV
jgi:cytosine/adenosine deaminase-related metal-dependent hydrolase